MSRNGKLFMEDSEDSVATETQESSDEEGDYEVNALLAERVLEDGIRYYLVNWQGYPDYRMTWEPEENVANEVLMAAWEKRKKLIAQGKLQPFDVDAWQAKRDKWRADRDDRARRRRIKLRKRKLRQGIPISASASDDEYDGGASPPPQRRKRRDLDSDDEDVIMVGTSPKKRLKTPVVKPRKGVAQKMKRKVVEESDDDNAGDDNSDHASLFEEGSQPIYPDLADEPAMDGSKTSRLPVTSAPKEFVVDPGKHIAHSAGQKKKVGPGLAKTRKPTTDSSQPTAKKSKKKDVLGANPFAPKAPYRQHTIRDKPKDQQGTQFKTLGQMGRMNNYARMEPPPDINQLTFVDMNKNMNEAAPKQEKPVSAPVTASKAPREIDSAYGRRSPSTGPRQRSGSPPAPAARPPPADPARRQTVVCWHWMNGDCRFTDKTCNYAHHAVRAEVEPFQPQEVQPLKVPPQQAQPQQAQPQQAQPQQAQPQQAQPQQAQPQHLQDPKQGIWPSQAQTTCFFWQQGKICKQGDRCEFAHADTGVYSQLWHRLPEETKAELRDKANWGFQTQIQALRKQPTCRYWKNGNNCKFTAAECRFAHHDPGQEISGSTGQRQASWESHLPPSGVAPVLSRQQQGITSIRGSASPVIANAMNIDSPQAFSAQSSNTGTPVRSPLTQSNIATHPHPQPQDNGSTPVSTRLRLPAGNAGWGTETNLDALNLDMEYLFEGVHENPKGQSVFTLWTSELDRQPELLVLQKRFLDLECKVYTSAVPGAWDYFRKKHSKMSLILVHQDVPLWRVPGLNDFLQVASGHVQFFSLAVSAEDEEQARVERIFPDGRITFITDDLFVYHPKAALVILQDVIKARKAKRNHKIAARPGIKDWLYQLALEHTAERGRQQSPEYMHLYHAICEVCPPEDEDPFDPPNPLPESALVSAPVDELPSFVGLWESQPAQATNYMVEWFAGWCLMNVEKFRRFVVCYEAREGGEGEAQRWRERFQHIGVVRPEQLLEQGRKK